MSRFYGSLCIVAASDAASVYTTCCYLETHYLQNTPRADSDTVEASISNDGAIRSALQWGGQDVQNLP